MRDYIAADCGVGAQPENKSGQADEITRILEKRGISKDVSVDTVHRYQGDERDVMIFSPAISKGISPGAATWVETPRNLVNVAIMRAREALFFVADFRVCRAQTGILGKFVRYVETIELLRKTSSAELQLFAWLVMQGKDPEVHKRIGNVEVDFVMSEGGIQLAIEVDGSQHAQQTEQDKARDAFLEGYGYKVLRIPARDIGQAPAVVMARIAKALELNEQQWGSIEDTEHLKMYFKTE